MIWRDILLAAFTDDAALRHGLAAVLGIAPEQVAVVVDEAAMPATDAGFLAVAVSRPVAGDAQHAVALYLFGWLAIEGGPAEDAALRALAARLGGAVVAPAPDPAPGRFRRYGPDGSVGEVSADLAALDAAGVVRLHIPLSSG